MNRIDTKIEWIDFAKGIAMLIVILYHLIGEFCQDIYLPILSTFHNSTFYIISGILFVYSMSNKDKCFGDILVKYILKLVLPFIIWSIIYSCGNVLLMHRIDVSYILIAFNKLWFFPILFLGIIFLYFAININIDNFKLIVRILLLAITLVSSFFSSFIAKTIAYIAIVYFGALIKDDVIKRNRRYYVVVLFSLIITLVNAYMFIARICLYDDIIAPSGLKLFIYLLSNFSGGVLVIFLSQILSNLKFIKWNLIKWIGSNSLYFYILHNVGMYYLELTDKSIFNRFVGCIICFICPSVAVLFFKRTKINSILFNISIKR